jgi:excisionase family DNA binding protein
MRTQEKETAANGGKGRPLTVAELRERPTITVDEAADVLAITRTGAYQAVRRGEIPSVRVGRRLIIPTTSLLRLLGVDDITA